MVYTAGMKTTRRLTINQLARLAGITRRTLHHYDQIGLLHPAEIGENGYRYYGDDALLRLQQILLYRQMGMGLEQIKNVLDAPGFDRVAALEGHRQGLLARAEQLMRLVDTVEKTILHLRGELEMSDQDLYAGFDEEKQKAYEQEARQRWGDAQVEQSSKRWNSYSRTEKNALMAENQAVTLGIADNMEKGYDSPEVQQWIDRWFKLINERFYTCSLEVFEALGHGYVEDPRFTETYEKIKPGMAAFMEKAMVFYCKVRKGV
jgi:DNA-binding transcriptional MerR regulator